MINLDTVFRSIINFKNARGAPTIEQKDLVKNFRALQQVVPDPPEEKAYQLLYHFILDHVRECQGDPELPSFERVQKHFEEVEGSTAVLKILDQIKEQEPYIGQDYRATLREYNNDQNVLRLNKVINNASKIAETGLEVGQGRKKRKLKGIADAISYIAQHTRDMQRNITGIKLEGQIVSPEDSDEMIEEYEKGERDPSESIGINTWLKPIDDCTKGLKNSELMIVAAYTGHCKTTFSMNMAYRALYGGWNTAFITLEMSYDEIRRHMYVLHSCNPTFKKKYPEYAHLVGNINYDDVRYSNLTAEEKKYWMLVCKDFNKNFNGDSETYGRFHVIQPDQAVTSVSDIELKLNGCQQELYASGRSLEFVVIDYISLLGGDDKTKSGDYNQTLNNIIKALKRLCLTFNNGKGIRMLSPFQVNRAGWREAKENEGHYNLTALSNAHEAERSADLVISLFKMDGEKEGNVLRICNLKNRRNKPFQPFNAHVNFDTRFIYNFSDTVEQSDSFVDVSAVV